MKQLILASGSPARKEMLLKTGVNFKVEVSNYQEDMALNLSPHELAKHLARGKAHEVASRHGHAVILAADSFAAFKDKLLGKPHTLKNAREMLTNLSGKQHIFITGFTILDTDSGKEVSKAVETKVYFKELTQKEINSYLSMENVLEKAGAYIIQGLGAALVEKIEGSHSNVMGLPFAEVATALKKFDIYLI